MMLRVRPEPPTAVRKRRAALMMRVRPEPPTAVRKRRAAMMLRVRPEPPTAVRKRRAAMMMMMMLMLGAAAFLACTHEEASPGPEASAESVLATQAAGVPEPADNPANPSKVELVRLLFWDPIFAGDRAIARPPGTAEGGEETAS